MPQDPGRPATARRRLPSPRRGRTASGCHGLGRTGASRGRCRKRQEADRAGTSGAGPRPIARWPRADRADHPAASWPTTLALLTWYGWRAGSEAARHGLNFLSDVTVATFHAEDNPNAIDSTLRGWSWIAGTSCWVEPTALAVFAFQRYQPPARPRASGRQAAARPPIAARRLELRQHPRLRHRVASFGGIHRRRPHGPCGSLRGSAGRAEHRVHPRAVSPRFAHLSRSAGASSASPRGAIARPLPIRPFPNASIGRKAVRPLRYVSPCSSPPWRAIVPVD